MFKVIRAVTGKCGHGSATGTTVPPGFPNIGSDVRRLIYKSIPAILNADVKSTFQSIFSYAERTTYDDLMKVRDIEHLALLMARAKILNPPPEKVYSSSKIKEIVNEFDPDKAMVEFSFFLEEELECKEELPVEAFAIMGETVSGLYDAMKDDLPSEIFNRIFTWNDPIFE